MAIQLVTTGKTIRDQVSAVEWEARVQRAAGHRVLAHYGVNDMTPKLLRDLNGGYFMMLRNHGGLVCGTSVAGCVVNHHWLEMACQGQIAALSAGQGNDTIPSKEACEYAHSQFMAAGNLFEGGKDWAACLRLADRLDPTYRD